MFGSDRETMKLLPSCDNAGGLRGPVRLKAPALRIENPPQLASLCLSSKPGMFSYILAAAIRAGCQDAHNELSPNLLSGASNPCMLAVKHQG